MTKMSPPRRSGWRLLGLGVPLLLAACVPQRQTIVVPQPQAVQRPQFAQPGIGQPAGVPALGSLPPSIVRAMPTPGPGMPAPGRPPSQQELAATGLTFTPNAQAGGCDVDMVLSRDTFFAAIPRLIAGGVLGQQVSPQLAQAQPLSVAMAYTLQTSTIIAHNILSQPGAPFSCHFRQAIAVPGPAGMQLLPMFEFTMDRNTDAQAPWPRLLTMGFSAADVNQFVAATPSFRLSPQAMAQIRADSGI